MNTQILGKDVRVISGLAEISAGYDVVLCDIWGVLHNGREAFVLASEALAAFRRQGGVVILITNAPRPSSPVLAQLLHLGVRSDAFDALVTSGDVTIGLLEDRIDEPLLHIGPPRDVSLFDAVAEMSGRRPKLTPLDGASYVLCTGLREDSTETVDDYQAELHAMASRAVTMICANPDIVIHRGDTVVYCAGALADRYESMGGNVIYAGKPHAPIYNRALALAESIRGSAVDPMRVLAIGDGMKTDIAGASRIGVDALLVTRGIHRSVLHRHGID